MASKGETIFNKVNRFIVYSVLNFLSASNLSTPVLSWLSKISYNLVESLTVTAIQNNDCIKTLNFH